MNEEFKLAIGRAIATEGSSLISSLGDLAQLYANQIVSGPESLTMSERDWDAFFDALRYCEKSRPKLFEALRNHQVWVNRPKA